MIFRDSTKVSQEIKIKYNGMVNLCNKVADLQAGELEFGRLREHLPYKKRELKMFVFADITFILEVTRKDYKWLNATPTTWSLLILNGPILITRGFHPGTVTSNGQSILESSQIQKYEESLMSNSLDTFGGFNFKKYMCSVVSENSDMVAKIQAGSNGYSKRDVMKILMEYNAWVLQQDSQKYLRSLTLPKIRPGN